MLKLQMVGLNPADANKMPADLSGGMVKRVALARSLALEPDLIFLDEPTSGLDPVSSDSFVELIKSLHDELNLTVVMVSHDLDTIVDISTQIVVLADRQVIASGPVETILSVRHPFIEEYFLGARGRKVLKNLPDYDAMMKRIGRA